MHKIMKSPQPKLFTSDGTVLGIKVALNDHLIEIEEGLQHGTLAGTVGTKEQGDWCQRDGSLLLYPLKTCNS